MTTLTASQELLLQQVAFTAREIEQANTVSSTRRNMRDDAIVRAYTSGINTRTIAQNAGLTPEGVRRVLRRHHVPVRPQNGKAPPRP